MAGPLKGTELPGNRTFVPGAEYGGAAPNLAGRGTGSTIIPPAGPDVDRQSQSWAVTDAGVTSNDGGHGISVLDISTVNPAFQGLAYTFPNDGTSTDNSWTLDIALPTNMSDTPNMRIRIFVQVTGTGTC